MVGVKQLAILVEIARETEPNEDFVSVAGLLEPVAEGFDCLIALDSTTPMINPASMVVSHE